MDRNELKVTALLEKISALTTNYENQCAEYRVDITILTQQKQELADELAEVRAQLEKTTEHAYEASEDVPQEDSKDTSD